MTPRALPAVLLLACSLTPATAGASAPPAAPAPSRCSVHLVTNPYGEPPFTDGTMTVAGVVQTSPGAIASTYVCWLASHTRPNDRLLEVTFTGPGSITPVAGADRSRWEEAPSLFRCEQLTAHWSGVASTTTWCSTYEG